MTKLVYAGNSVFGINFNLYSLEDAIHDESKTEIQNAFVKQFGTKIGKALDKCGLFYHGLEYYSPHEYNFSGDSLDLKLAVKDKKKLKQFITVNSSAIQDLMDKNQSYDGYMALTRHSVEAELDAMKKEDYEPDILVIAAIMDRSGIEFKKFDIMEYVVWEPEVENMD